MLITTEPHSKAEQSAWTVWEAITYDYAQTYDTPISTKPTLDAEAWYENNKDQRGFGRALYGSLL